MKRVLGIGLLLACGLLLIGWLAVPAEIPWLGRIWRLAGEPDLRARVFCALIIVAAVFFLSVRMLKSGPL